MPAADITWRCCAHLHLLGIAYRPIPAAGVGNDWQDLDYFLRSQRPHLRQRADRPWDDVERRPKHADRLKCLERQVIAATMSRLPLRTRASRKFLDLINRLASLTA